MNEPIRVGVSRPTPFDNHEWVVDSEEITIGASEPTYTVRFRTSEIPEFILQNEGFEVISVWAENRRKGLSRLLGPPNYAISAIIRFPGGESPDE